MAKKSIKPLNKLSPTSIRPEGWLLCQLRLANDLQKRIGALDGLLKDGEWENGEALPRYVRGLVLLAGVMGDKALYEKAESYLSPIFASANAGGDFGPNEGNYLSAKIEAIKAILSYYELTNDERSLMFLRKFFKNQFNTFSVTPCWYHSRARLLEEIPAIEAVFKQTDSEWLHDLGEKLREESNDWFRLANKFRYKHASSRYLNLIRARALRRKIQIAEQAGDGGAKGVKPLTVDRANAAWKRRNHQIAVETSGVNLAKAIKYPSTYGRFVGDNEIKDYSIKMFNGIMAYHGNATGMFSCDYRISGSSPNRGIDLESAVETIESLVDVLAETANLECVDALEQIVYNLIPAAAFDDVSAVQDIIVPNQTEAAESTKEFFKESAVGNAFISRSISRGAVAFISAYPLFMRSICMTRENELNFLSYAPCSISTQVGGSQIRIKEDTGYPFRNSIVFRVEEAEGDPEIKINFRVPKNTMMHLVSGGQVVASGDKVISVKCVLKKGSTFMLKMEIPLCVTENRGHTLTLSKGNIIMASRIADRITKSANDKLYGVSFVKKWNFTPVVSKRANGGVRRLYDSEKTIVNNIGALPYDHDNPPFELHIRSKLVLNWSYNVDGVCQIPKKAEFSEESLERVYVPMGCTNVRICQFPPCYK